MRCAVVEFNKVHGELLPTLVLLLNLQGIEVDVFASYRVMANNPFTLTKGLNYRSFLISRLAFRMLSSLGFFHRYDFLIFNSLEIYGSDPTWLQRTISRWKGSPVLAIVHGPSAVGSWAMFSPTKAPLVLSALSAKTLPLGSESSWIAPVFLASTEQTAERSGPARFCVPGNISADRRNYAALIDAVGELTRSGHRDFVVSLVGRSATDGQAIKERIHAEGLQHYFEFHDSDIPYAEFYFQVARSHFILPLIDRTSAKFHCYYEGTVTSSLLLSLGFSIVPVLERDLAELHGVAKGAITYSSQGLAGAMKLALQLAEPRRIEMRGFLAAARERLLEESDANLRALVSRVLASGGRQPIRR